VTENNEVDLMNDYQEPITGEMRLVELRRYLQEAQEANEAGRYKQTDDFLTKAAHLASEEATLQAEYRNAVNAINTQRAQQASQFSQQIRSLLAAEPLDESQITSLLEQLAPLDEEKAAVFQRQLADKRDDQQGQQVFWETKTACEALWQRAEDLIAQNTPYPIILTETYEKAVSIVEQAVAVSDLPELKGLLRTAQQEQQNARNRFEVLSTAAEVGAYKEMMDILDREKDESKTIQLVGPGGELLDTMTVREAKEQVTVMAEEFAHRKAAGYREAAAVHMAAHAPGAAMTELKKSEQLYMLNDEDKRRLANYRQKTVEPELTRFNEAHDLLEKSRNKINPVEGWRLIDAANEQYEWLPGLDEARAHLLPRLQTHVEQAIEAVRQILQPDPDSGHIAQFDKQAVAKAVTEAQTAVTLTESLANFVARAASNIGLAQQRARDAQRMADESKARIANLTEGKSPEEYVLAEARVQSAETYARFAEEEAERAAALGERRQSLEQLRQQAQTLLRQAETQQTLIGELDTAVQKINHLLQTGNVAAAGNEWKALENQRGKTTIEAYGPLNRLARDLDARLNITGLLARLDQDCAANDSARVSEAIKACDQAARLQENLDYADQLAQMRGKLESRLAFLTGQSHVQAGDADAALQQLAKVTSGPHVKEARRQIADIQKELKQDKAIKRALDKAKSFLETDPKLAYDTLKPYEKSLSRHHDEVTEALSDAREKWEAQVLAAIQSGLDEALDDEKVVALRALEKELRTELGVTGHRLAKRALACCLAYEAETAVTLKEYDDAIELWNQAIDLDRKVAYVNGRIAAQKQQAEQLVRENPEAAEQIIFELQKEIYDDPELHYWAARLYIQQAQAATTTSDADTLYGKAATEIAIGSEQIENQTGVKWAAFKGKLKTLQTIALTGQEVERQKEQIERQLTPSRTVSAFHNARREAETLLQNHPQYPRPETPALARWWQILRQKVIAKLETEASQIPADQIWRRFEPLGKILALDEDHGDASAMLYQIGSLVRQLEREVEQFNQDSDGLSINVTSDADVLTKQIEYIQDIQKRSDAVYATLTNFSNHPILRKQSGTALATLNKLAADLQITQERFDRFNNLKGQAEASLTIARASGDWNAFDKLLGEIANAGFAGHRTTNALQHRRDQDQARRQELQEWAKSLESQAQQGNFITALRLAERLQSQELGDPTNTFGIQGNIQYHDPIANQLRRGLRRVQPLLQGKAQQLAQISDWLLHCGLSILSEQHDLVNDTTRLANAPTIINWSHEKQQVITYKKYGNFKKAIEACHKADHGNPLPNTLSLKEAVQRLSGPPLSVQQAQSSLARQLLTQASQKRDELEEDQQNVTETIAWLKQQQSAWEDSWAAFINANQQLRKAQKSLNPFTKKASIQTAQEKYDFALYQCVEICSEHPDLQGIQRAGDT
jgi:hypothetical protein